MKKLSSIKTKFLLCLIIGSLFSTSITLLTTINQTIQHFEDDISRMESTFERLSQLLAYPVWSFSIETSEDIIDAYFIDKQVVKVSVYDEKDNLLIEKNKESSRDLNPLSYDYPIIYEENKNYHLVGFVSVFIKKPASQTFS